MNKLSGKPHLQNSLSEVHESVLIPSQGPWWRHWLAITGPALMVAVGYMDPGNWATDIAGGSRYNYSLIWVLLMSNMMAILLQSLAARLGIVRRRDLAQICHEEYPPVVNIPLYILAEIAITACDAKVSNRRTCPSVYGAAERRLTTSWPKGSPAVASGVTSDEFTPASCHSLASAGDSARIASGPPWRM